MKKATDWSDVIVCPYCGDEDHEHTDYPSSLRHDGDKADVFCHECERTFTVHLCVEYTYQSTGKP
jgi:transposase-like protein